MLPVLIHVFNVSQHFSNVVLLLVLKFTPYSSCSKFQAGILSTFCFFFLLSFCAVVHTSVFVPAFAEGYLTALSGNMVDILVIL